MIITIILVSVISLTIGYVIGWARCRASLNPLTESLRQTRLRLAKAVEESTPDSK